MAKVIIYPDRKRAMFLLADGDEDMAAVRSDAAALKSWLDDGSGIHVLIFESAADVEVRHG